MRAPASVADVCRAVRRGAPRPELEARARALPLLLRGVPSPGVARPVLIGQAPGPRTHPDLALFPAPRCSAGGRLFEMTGLGVDEYMQTFDRVNILYEHPGKGPSGTEDRFPRREARASAQAMRPFLVGRQVLLVGRDVALAFGVEDAPVLQWQTYPKWPFRFALLPHPSGRNHWYNTARNRDSAVAFLREWIAERARVGVPAS